MTAGAHLPRLPRAPLLPGMLGTLKEGLRGLDRHAWFRAPALALVEAMNRDTFRHLRREPAIADVFVKGSFVRGPFRPLASDVDLVLVLRDAALREPVDDLRRVFAALAAARRRNLSVRDWWQHVILESELPLVRRFWALYGADEWRDASGAPPLATDGTADLPALVLAQWYQQCLWSGSAVQKYLDPASTVHDLRAGLRKAAFFASRLALLDDLGEARLGAGDLFALRCRHAREIDAAWRPPGRASAERLPALVDMMRALEASARRLGATSAGGDAGFRFASNGALYLGLREGLTDAELAAELDALRRRGDAGPVVTWLVPALAWRLWPRPCAEERFPGDEGSIDVGFRQRLHLFETLFLPSSLRLALSFPDADARLRRHLWTLLRAWLLHARDRWAGTRGDLARELLSSGTGNERLDSELRPLLASAGGASSELSTRAALSLGEAIVREIGAVLPRFAAGAPP